MSGAASWDHASQRDAVRGAIKAFVRIHGKKRGLALAADAIGMGERACRHAYDGGEFAADPERAARADEARLALIAAEIQRLNDEAAELQHRRLLRVGIARKALDCARGVLRGPRARMLPAGAAG